MKVIKYLLLVVLSSVLLSSCATGPPTKIELESADYGSSITQNEAQKLAEKFLYQHLKDPYSAKCNWSNVYKGWLREAIINGSGLIFGYILDVDVNAKNSYGGYVGIKKYHFVFYNGSIKTVYGPKEMDGRSYMGKIY
jgi:hypothetical protein